MVKAWRLPISLVAAGALLATSLPAFAQPTDLVGARAGQAENSLRNRGYVLDHTAGSTQYWWNGGDRQCISLYVADGRYRDINATSSSNCRTSGGSKKDNSGALIAGALAIGILAAAAASSKKKHDDDRYDDRNDYRSYSPSYGVDCYRDQRACYERGRGYSAYWTNREFRYRY